MRVLDTKSGQFVDIDPEALDEYGEKEVLYAILSHTWDKKGEQTYEQLKKIQLRYASPSQTPQDPTHSDVQEASPSEQDPDRPHSTVTLPQDQPMLEGQLPMTPPIEVLQNGPDSPANDALPPPGSSQVPPESNSATTPPCLTQSRPSIPWWIFMLLCLAPMTPWWIWIILVWWTWMTGIIPSPTAFGRLTQSEVDALLGAVAETYHLTNPTPHPASKSIWDDPELSPKIRDACRVARENGYDYIWIDSCCIDKSSSSELSEAINSMYKWYDLAAVCYAYLADVPPGEDHHSEDSAFRKSQWFLRGWTLQELIAPISVVFLSQDWTPIGSKHALVDLVESVTKIDYKALLHVEPLDTFSVAQRLSWAANRKTTRVEDRAYSLLGLFDINMPTLYGEGDRAFRRLQEQIMQRTPDQSLFAWGKHYPSSKISQDTDVLDTLKAHSAVLWTWGGRSDPFSTSPDYFEGCEGVRTARREAGQLLSSNSHKIAYTHTPYGISTQFFMVPLTRDLLLRAIPHCSEDFQLDTGNLPEGSQWYLLILQCELGEHQGYCIGRVCYLTPSEESDINSVYTGYIQITSPRGQMLRWPGLFLLSPETIKNCRPQPELKTVYIPHPDRDNLSRSSNLQRQPYTTITLVLLRATRDALRSRGYKADLRNPDPDHLTTYWLTLSKDEHTITVEFQHTLENDGEWFTIEGEVKMSGSRGQLDSAPDSDQAEHHTVSWSDHTPWWTNADKLGSQNVKLNVAGSGTLTVDLGLGFGGQGLYVLRVDVLSDASPASSAVKPAVDQEEEGERTRKAHHLKQSKLTMWFKRIGREMEPSVEDGDVVASSDDMEGGDGVLA